MLLKERILQHKHYLIRRRIKRISMFCNCSIILHRKRKGMKNNQQKKETVDEEDISLLS